jgi:hypothetical protein
VSLRLPGEPSKADIDQSGNCLLSWIRKMNLAIFIGIHLALINPRKMKIWKLSMLLMLLPFFTKAQGKIDDPFAITLDMFAPVGTKTGTGSKLTNLEDVTDKWNKHYEVVNATYGKGVKIKYQGKKEIHGKYFALDQGQLRSESLYSMGLKEGKEINYHTDGTVKSEYEYSRNKWHGPYTEYYMGGRQISTKGSYKDGKPDGLEIQYHENGKKKSQKTYVNGVVKGTYCQWNQNGVETSCNDY